MKRRNVLVSLTRSGLVLAGLPIYAISQPISTMAQVITTDPASLEFWINIVKATQPYVEAFEKLYNLAQLVGGDKYDARLKKIEDELKRISGQIAQLEETIINKLLDQVAKQLSAEVLAYKETLGAYVSLRQQGILDNLLTTSAVTKNHLFQYIDDKQTSPAFRYFCGSLLSSLVGIRTTCISLYDAPIAKIDGLFKPEIRGYLSRIPGINESAVVIANNRVKATRSIYRIDDAGGASGTVFIVARDGKTVYGSHWSPIKNSKISIDDAAEKWERAHSAFVDQAHAESMANLLSTVTQAQALLETANKRSPNA